MRRSYKVEIQPTPTQRRKLLRNAGCARWAWNLGLQRKQEAWSERKAALESGVQNDKAPKVPSAIDLHKELNKLKKQDQADGGVPWMYESSKHSPQNALRNLDLAFAAFFRRLKRGDTPGFPKFKSRSRGVGGFRSQRCSECGHMEVGNRSSQTMFRCLGCGHAENADINAAVNIIVAGSFSETKNARGADIRRHALGADRYEARIGVSGR